MHDGRVPAHVPASRWHFDPGCWPRDDLVAVGADLEPATLLAAYRSGVFPMPLAEKAPMVWWSPLHRGVLEPASLRVTRSLRQSARRFRTTVNAAFDQVVAACADPARSGAWIDDAVSAAYRRLHQLGWAHSVETWTSEGELAGGLYGVGIGGLFAGESMFSRRSDASKVALVRLVELLNDEYVADRLIDVQWRTPHLLGLGAQEISRAAYLERLRCTLKVPLPASWRT